MRFLRIALLISVCLISMGKIQAQVDFHLGLTTGCGATFVADKGISDAPRYKSVMTYNWSPVGINAGVDFGKKFGLTVEGIVANHGQNFSIIDIADKVVGGREIDLKYFQLPVLMRFMNEGNSAVRGNFNLGGQVSFLTSATDKLYYSASTQTFPAGAALPTGAVGVKRPDGNTQAIVRAQPETIIMSNKDGDFKKIGYQVVAAFGLDFDLSRHLYFSVQLRGNYNLMDMRSGKTIDEVKQHQTADVYGRRADYQIGLQGGVHYVFSSTRSFRFKGAKPAAYRH
ncbi:MAG: outer membrane beta-barrel protein [Chryseolinea sp.]